MESGSSGSFQSSSGGIGGVGGGGGGGSGGGGDEEYESRGESMSSFLNSEKQLLLSHQQQNPPFLHPSSNQQNLDASFFLQDSNFHQQYNNNEEMGWDRGFIRSSETSYGNFGNFSSTPSASSTLPSASSQNFSGTHGDGRMGSQNPLSASLLHSGGGGEVAINNPTTTSNHQPPPPPANVGATKGSNPKKRTRASRRAPTTVLTTDTTNFRQMVQEFTGFPAAPFSSNPGSSTFTRRFDLFSSGGASSIRGGHQLDHLSSLYPLRPSAQKHTPHSLIMNAMGNPNNNNSGISNNTLGLSQHVKQPHPHQNIFSMQNQMLNFHPQVQSCLPPSTFNNATRPNHQGSSSTNMPHSPDELGSFLDQQRRSEEVERQPSWRGDNQGGRSLNNEGQDGQNQLVGTFDGNVNQHGTNINSPFKLNSSYNSSDFNPEKALDNDSSSGGVEFTNFK